MPERVFGLVTCLVTPHPNGETYSISVSEDERVYGTFELALDQRKRGMEGLVTEIREELRLLAAKGRGARLIVPDNAYLVGYMLALALQPHVSAIGVAEPVTLARAPGHELEPPPATPQPRDATPRAGSAAPNQPAAPRALGDLGMTQLLREAEKLTAWNDPKVNDVLRAIRNHRDATVETEAAIKRALERGKRQISLLNQFKNAILKQDGVEERRLEAEVLRSFPFLAKEVEKRRAYGRAAAGRRREAHSRTQQGLATSAVKPGLAEHDISALTAAPSWELLIDETGSFEQGGPREAQSKVVGVLVPSGTVLPPLAPGWHAADRSLSEVDAAVQAVLDAPVGILGLPLAGMTAGADPWVHAVLELLQWVLRLMPVGGPTKLTVSVEQRGEHSSGSSWLAAITEVRRQLVHRHPNRYASLSIEVRVQGKADNPLNGYADAIAFTYGSTAQASQDRLMRTGLQGRCLWGGNPRLLRDAWDAIGFGAGLGGEHWRDLVSDPDVRTPASIAGRLLERVVQSCRTDSALWERFLRATQAHLDSKAIDLRRLAREVDWLSRAAPEEATLPARVRLAWLVANLELANHEGAADLAEAAELEALSERLADEAPELVCLADLDRSVLATNRFDFDGAEACLQRWRDAKPREPGLQLWGRLRSQHGQLAAFKGEHERAEAAFIEAIEAFGKLSDPALARREQGQTGVYLAIATMDRAGAPLELVRQRVNAIVPLTRESIEALSLSEVPAEKYNHHLLLRYLVAHGTVDEKAAYLSTRAAWETGTGHPWQLIEAYRGVLLATLDPTEAAKRLDDAVAGTLKQGPTVRFIGQSIARLRRALFGGAGPSEEVLTELRGQLPGAFTEASRPGDTGALQQFASDLPFNFR